MASTGAARSLKSPASIRGYSSFWKRAGRRIVFTNGCFDLYHAGHAYLLARCKQTHPDALLVVGINSDASVARLKPGRPIIPQVQRSNIVACHFAVDAVVIFEEDSPLEVIKLLKPSVILKGSDYFGKAVVGSELARVQLIELHEEECCGTSDIVNKIRSMKWPRK